MYLRDRCHPWLSFLSIFYWTAAILWIFDTVFLFAVLVAAGFEGHAVLAVGVRSVKKTGVLGGSSTITVSPPMRYHSLIRL